MQTQAPSPRQRTTAPYEWNLDGKCHAGRLAGSQGGRRTLCGLSIGQERRWLQIGRQLILCCFLPRGEGKERSGWGDYFGRGMTSYLVKLLWETCFVTWINRKCMQLATWTFRVPEMPLVFTYMYPAFFTTNKKKPADFKFLLKFCVSSSKQKKKTSHGVFKTRFHNSNTALHIVYNFSSTVYSKI